MKTDKLLDKCFYIIGWVFIAIGAAAFLLYPAGILRSIGLLLSGLRGHAGDIRAAAWQNNNLPVLPSDCCIWGSCGRLVYDLTDDRAAFTGKALYWDALQRSVPMDCTCNRNRKLSGEKSCACNHRDCAAWIILTVSGKAAGSDHCNRYRTYPNMPSRFRRCYRTLQAQKQMLQYK